MPPTDLPERVATARLTAATCADKAASILNRAESLCQDALLATSPQIPAITALLEVADGWRKLAETMSTNYFAR